MSLGLPLVVRVAEKIFRGRPGQVVAIILPLQDNPYTTAFIIRRGFNCFGEDGSVFLVTLSLS